MTSLLEITGHLATATLFGATVFFSTVMAPLIFVKLPPDIAGTFIRAVFPWYYLIIIGGAALAAATLVTTRPADAAAMAVVSASGMLARQCLMPRINHARDASLAGEIGAARRFTRMHRLSVIINVVQISIIAGVLVRLAMS